MVLKQEEFSLTPGMVSTFVLFRTTADWMRSTHIRDGNVVYLF